MKQKSAIIAYDISCNRRRRQALKVLQAWQLASQYSVFECQLARQEAEELLLQLTHILDPEADKLLFTWLDGRRESRALTKAAQLGFRRAVVYAG